MRHYFLIADMSVIPMDALQRTLANAGISMDEVEIQSPEEFIQPERDVNFIFENLRDYDHLDCIDGYFNYVTSTQPKCGVWRNPFTSISCTLQKHFFYGSTPMT